MSSIGIMDGAFFVGRKEVVDWINSTLDVNIAKIEDTASGAIACQLLDVMHPGQVPMHKVNWSAKQNFELIANYKILQTSFSKLHIDKFVDVDRLISGRYMDNLEFMQWFKRFFEMNVSDKGDYDCAGQRAKGKGGSTYIFAAGASRPSKPISAPAARAAKSSPTKPVSSSPAKPGSAPSARQQPVAPKANATQNASNIAPSADNAKPTKPAASTTTTAAAKGNGVASVGTAKSKNYEAEIAALQQANEEQARKFSELKLEVDGLEKERDFYFDKLRDIEILLQDVEEQGLSNPTTASIFKILYATADGFQPIDDKAAAENDAAPEVAADETY